MKYQVKIIFRDGDTVTKHFRSRRQAGFYCSRLRSKGTTKRIRMTKSN